MNQIWQNPSLIAHAQTLARSLKHWTGRDLLPGLPPGTTPAEFAEKLFIAPFVLVSHGTEADPVLNYGNATALKLWEMSWDELTRTPSRLTAEAPNREERARLLAAVTANGFIDDYSGIRISKTGRRFRITQATVWNLIDERGGHCGQAAMFSRWDFL
ncbi:MAG: MEKHLA domain-containing protein [Verrucomicrobiae bacterium]|nr:MEKHLA domain-containing protein [Verrucomicrobiae bacterium]